MKCSAAQSACVPEASALRRFMRRDLGDPLVVLAGHPFQLAGIGSRVDSVSLQVFDQDLVMGLGVHRLLADEAVDLLSKVLVSHVFQGVG